MYRSLYFKIVLIFVVFMITVMSVVGTVLLNSVFQFYLKDFTSSVSTCLAEDAPLTAELKNALSEEQYPARMCEILSLYGTRMGMDTYRNFYVLDMEGQYLAGSDEALGQKLLLTPNILKAMKKAKGDDQILGSDYADYAEYLTDGSRECIVYIKDTQEEMRTLSWELFSLILQSLLFGLVISFVLSFFLAKAITRPIQRLTRSADQIASGDFSSPIEVDANDEIGTLTETFNYMNTTLQNTLVEVDGERQKLETLFTYLKDGVIAFSDHGSVIQINKAASELLGDRYTPDITFSGLLEQLYVEFSQAYVASENGEKSYMIRDVEIGERAVDINIGPLNYIEDNKPHSGMIVVMHDITERYELDKSRREFVANVSHELRTPLTFIKGATETLMTYPDMEESTKKQLMEESMVESDRMLNIIMDLLTLSRLDGKRTQWKVTTFDICSSLSHLCSTLRMQADEKQQLLTFESAETVCEITGDKDRLEQVVINILSNAVKYTPEKGSIHVNLESGTEKVKLSIRDTGIGIPAEDLPHIFDRFYRVEKSRTSEKGGTGLGLAIAKEIIEAHGGKIKVISASGKGTEVVMILPRRSALENAEE